MWTWSSHWGPHFQSSSDTALIWSDLIWTERQWNLYFIIIYICINCIYIYVFLKKEKKKRCSPHWQGHHILLCHPCCSCPVVVGVVVTSQLVTCNAVLWWRLSYLLCTLNQVLLLVVFLYIFLILFYYLLPWFDTGHSYTLYTLWTTCVTLLVHTAAVVERLAFFFWHQCVYIILYILYRERDGERRRHRQPEVSLNALSTTEAIIIIREVWHRETETERERERQREIWLFETKKEYRSVVKVVVYAPLGSKS